MVSLQQWDSENVCGREREKKSKNDSEFADMTELQGLPGWISQRCRTQQCEWQTNGRPFFYSPMYVCVCECVCLNNSCGNCDEMFQLLATISAVPSTTISIPIFSFLLFLPHSSISCVPSLPQTLAIAHGGRTA